MEPNIEKIIRDKFPNSIDSMMNNVDWDEFSSSLDKSTKDKIKSGNFDINEESLEFIKSSIKEENLSHIVSSLIEEATCDSNTDLIEQVASNTDLIEQVASNTDLIEQVASNTDLIEQVASNTDLIEQVKYMSVRSKKEKKKAAQEHKNATYFNRMMTRSKQLQVVEVNSSKKYRTILVNKFFLKDNNSNRYNYTEAFRKDNICIYHDPTNRKRHKILSRSLNIDIYGTPLILKVNPDTNTFIDIEVSDLQILDISFF